MSSSRTESSIKPPIARLEGHTKNLDPLSKSILKLDNELLYTPEAQRKHSHLGIFLSTNEAGTDKIYQRCLEEPLVPNSCHIGFSGWFNLNIVALRRSQRAIICDINAENAMFFDFTLKFLRESVSKEEFFKNLRKFISDYRYDMAEEMFKKQKNPDYISPFEKKYQFEISVSEFESPIDELLSYKDNPHSWLYNDERYQHIRRLALLGRIVTLTQDIRNFEIFEKIKRLIQDNGDLTIDTIYVSNIPCQYYLHAPLDWALFIHTMNALIQKNTLVIDAGFDMTSGVLIQQIRKPLSNSTYLLEEIWKCPNFSKPNDLNNAKDKKELAPKSESSFTLTASITILLIACIASIYLLHANKTSIATPNRPKF